MKSAMNKPKFGLSLSNRAVVFGWSGIGELLDAAKIAEDSGYFDGIWTGDNLLSKPRLDALVLLLTSALSRSLRVPRSPERQSHHHTPNFCSTWGVVL